MLAAVILPPRPSYTTCSATASTEAPIIVRNFPAAFGGMGSGSLGARKVGGPEQLWSQLAGR